MPLAQGRTTNLHRLLVERLGLGVLTSVRQVISRLIGEPSRLWEHHAVPLNPARDGNGVGEQPIAEGPVGIFNGRERLGSRLERPVRPRGAACVVHRIFEDLLNHAVDAKSLPFPIDANQREAAQSLEHIVDHERVALGTGKRRFEGRPELGHPAGQ